MPVLLACVAVAIALGALLLLMGSRHKAAEGEAQGGIQKDVKAVVDEIKKLYDEKALLVRENEKLKEEITKLKKKP